MAGKTILDIAREANVGKSTVSRVINGSGYTSPDTARRVREVMAKYNYMPSSAARSLSTQTSDTIGIILPESNNPFFSDILLGVSRIVDTSDLTLILCGSANKVENDYRALRVMLRQRVRGLIYVPAEDYSAEQDYEKLKSLLEQISCPVVLLDRPIENLPIDGVFTDNFKGAYMATEALVLAGHRDIGIIAGDQELHIGRERIAGFYKALEDSGIAANPRHIIPGQFDRNTTYTLMKQALCLTDRPTAYFISNNLSEAGFLQAVYECGLRIPDDIAFVGFDEMYGQDAYGLPYSCLERDVLDMGRKAAQLLIKRFEDPKRPYEREIIMPRLKLLGSEKYVRGAEGHRTTEGLSQISVQPGLDGAPRLL
jgi:LacI family transcriptional regulator